MLNHRTPPRPRLSSTLEWLGVGGVEWYPARLIDFAMTTSNQLHQSSLARFQPGPNRLEALSDLKPRPPVAARHRGKPS